MEKEKKESEYKNKNNYKESNNAEDKNNYEDRKKIKNKLSKCESMLKKYENQLEEYRKEEKDILKFFETSSDYDDDKSRRLLEVKRLIEETENEWLLTNEEIDNIKSVL